MRSQPTYITPFEQVSALVRGKRARNDVYQRRLACAVFAEEHMHLACSDVEVHLAQCGDTFETFGDPPNDQNWGASC